MHNGETSLYFVSDLGLAEGDPLSPLLYTLFINGLLKEMWEKHEGYMKASPFQKRGMPPVQQIKAEMGTILQLSQRW
jgi:hypothetical protein